MPASDIEAEASEWLIRLETDPTPELRASFQEWLAADPRNRAAYVRLEKTWQHADVLRRLRPLDGEVDENIIDKFGEPDAIIAVTPRRKPWLPWVAVAASLLIAVTAGTYGWLSYSRAGWQAYRTEQGGFQRIALPDGSTAFLNTNSEIRVKMTSDRREIVLAQGEALFTVAHDPQRPFDVTAADTVVRAVGTEFSVRLRDQQVDVIVKEGRVAIDPPDDLAEPQLAQQTVTIPKLSTLAAGESVSVKSRKLVVRKVPAEDMTRKLAWTQGRLWFDRVTLVEAVAEFNRYNRRQIVIDDPSIETFHIGGTFDTQDLDSFVSALSSFGIRADSTTSGADGSAEIIRLSRPKQ